MENSISHLKAKEDVFITLGTPKISKINDIEALINN